ncbi:16S rRNA (guanine(966)-N(2))-methyltransferase RsmD [Pectinatus frisingensis]|uniref:16S rRNA (guanine(966)-N(2))-methyltransferase RsmD n=1 Tax=Pectinatus frisingensis TaxID=865 RepID=UPI0018C5C020|nr:16S rRNA (guanine(966)-N(2))-methyltransferase RsmD [Pectinatus frisingensis]
MRVISGSARGAKLKAPHGMNTRPTADRIKESLFNILQGQILDAGILDLFAGSGALGIESLSRGAARAVFVDKSIESINTIKDNLQHTHFMDKADICHNDALFSIKKYNGRWNPFDIIFCDPPYHMGWCQKALLSIDEYVLLKNKGLLIAEIGADEELNTEDTKFNLLRSKVYGATTKINIYEFMADGTSRGE